MRTNATNRTIHKLLTQLHEEKLIPCPEFQRLLVWNNKNKCSFLETVLLGYPFPEIYVAAGEVDVDTGETKEMLVDGQQRITTLDQYFMGSPDLHLSKVVQPYAALSKEQKKQFLQYEVVVRNLGKVSLEQIREAFCRINAASYAYNAVEIHGAYYEGDYKTFAEQIIQQPFFEKHLIFSVSEIRSMQDIRFVLMLITTLISTYFNRDTDIEDYLERFNDEFPLKEDVERELSRVFRFIEDMNLPGTSRVWKKEDLFTLLVEVHRALVKEHLQLDTKRVAHELSTFYGQVDTFQESAGTSEEVAKYYKASLEAPDNRSSRIIRGQTISRILKGRGLGMPIRHVERL